MLYSALVKNGNRVVFITNREYRNKAEFIQDLRHNGYKVNEKKVKPSDLFDYIMNYTNCESWDWAMTKIPE